jgi:hypothetical protein
MSRSPAIFAIVSGLVVVAAIIIALLVLPSPWEARKRKLDDVRVRDLSALAGAIAGYARSNDGRLPAKLSDIQNSSTQQNMAIALQDPVTGAPYDYIVKDEKNYELCARFETTGPDIAVATYLVSWRHEVGPRCFALKLSSPSPPLPPIR